MKERGETSKIFDAEREMSWKEEMHEKVAREMRREVDKEKGVGNKSYIKEGRRRVERQRGGEGKGR